MKTKVTKRNVCGTSSAVARLRSKRAPIAAIVLALALTTGCSIGRDFREAALPAFQSGTLSIATGLLNGLFAAIAVEPDVTP